VLNPKLSLKEAGITSNCKIYAQIENLDGEINEVKHDIFAPSVAKQKEDNNLD